MNWIKRIANLLRRTTPSDPGGQYPLHVQRTAGQPVTEQTALTVGAYWCCVRVISETISQMPWRIWQVRVKGREIARHHPADRLVHRAPNDEIDAPVWRELMLRWVLTWGNAYCEIVRDRSYRPTAVWPIEPWRVTPRRVAGRLVYEVQDRRGPINLDPADVLHFRGLGDDVVGYSVIGYMARCLGLSMAQETSMASQMEYGARPSGLLTPAGGGSLQDKATEKLVKQWNHQVAGSTRHGRVAFLPNSLEWHPMQIPNTDAQLLESRQFSVIDCCRFLRVPPHKVFDLTRATFSNITHQSLEFLIDTLGPWISKFEAQADRKLISPAMRDSYESRIDPTAILRMDPETRIKYYQGLRDLGAFSPNDVCAAEGMNDLGPDGDLYLVPVNLQTLERAGRPPEEPKPPTPPATPGDQVVPELVELDDDDQADDDDNDEE